MPTLDPETFKYTAEDFFWRFWTTPRLGQFDIAVMAREEFNPAPWALAQLGRELERIDDLFYAALVAAKSGWTQTYGREAPHDGWTLTRIAIEDTGDVTLIVYEGEIDTYGSWQVAMRDDAVIGLQRRQT